jgi:CRP-like cAMP-binding protein
MSDTLSKPTLPTFSWIGHLKEDDRDLLSSYGEFFPGHPGTVIIEEGAMQTEVFVVISGKLEVHAKQEDGSVALLAGIGPGETLGEISLFSPGPAAASVTAVEFSQLWRIADTSLMEFMEENPGAGNLLLRTLATILAQRLRQMNPKAFGLSTYAVVDSPELESQAPSAAAEARAVASPTPASPIEARRAPPLDIPQTYQGKRLSSKTQLIPNQDIEELEPIPPVIEAKVPPTDEPPAQ